MPYIKLSHPILSLHVANIFFLHPPLLFMLIVFHFIHWMILLAKASLFHRNIFHSCWHHKVKFNELKTILKPHTNTHTHILVHSFKSFKPRLSRGKQIKCRELRQKRKGCREREHPDEFWFNIISCSYYIETDWVRRSSDFMKHKNLYITRNRFITTTKTITNERTTTFLRRMSFFFVCTIKWNETHFHSLLHQCTH